MKLLRREAELRRLSTTERLRRAASARPPLGNGLVPLPPSASSRGGGRASAAASAPGSLPLDNLPPAVAAAMLLASTLREPDGSPRAGLRVKERERLEAQEKLQVCRHRRRPNPHPAPPSPYPSPLLTPSPSPSLSPSSDPNPLTPALASTLTRILSLTLSFDPSPDPDLQVWRQAEAAVRARVAAEAARDEASRSRWRACEARRQKDERRQRQRRQAQRAQHARHLEDCRQAERAQAHEARAEQARQHVESSARRGPARMAPTGLHQRHGMPRAAPWLRPASACPPPGPRRPAMSARVCHLGAAARGGLPPRRLRCRHGRGGRARDRLQAGRRLHARRAELARRMGGARLSKAARLHSAGLSTVRPLTVTPRVAHRPPEFILVLGERRPL